MSISPTCYQANEVKLSEPSPWENVDIDLLAGQYTIEIPGNGIDRCGIDLIQRKLCGWGFGSIPEVIPLPSGEKAIWYWDWKVGGKGEYVGALPKRIGKFVWQAIGEKLTPEQLSELGNIGSAHSGRHCKYWFDVVAHADWERPDFGQPADCCYWGCHASAKDMILDNGGGAIRFFQDEHYNTDNGFARAWLAPWYDCWIVFNGYGLETLSVARILAVHLGHAYYRRISLQNNGEHQGNLWINGGVAYLVGPQESVLKWGEIDLEWDEPEQLRCEVCECRLAEDDHYHSPDGEDLCEECYNERCFCCSCCGEDHWCNDGHVIPHGEMFCQDCWEESYFKCKVCEKDTLRTLEMQDSDGDCYCEECFYEYYAYCENCHEVVCLDDIRCGLSGTSREGRNYCKECAANHPEGEKEDLCPAA